MKQIRYDMSVLEIGYFDAKAEEKIQQKKDVFLTKDDKVDIIKTIYSTVYTATIIQYIAIIASVVAIVKFMISK